LAAWASAVATKVGLMALRSRCRERRAVRGAGASDELEMPDSRYQIDGQLEARDGIRRLQTALAGMNGVRAEVLLLHDVVGLELAEIAALIGASTAALQSRLVRGRRELIRRAAELEGAPE